MPQPRTVLITGSRSFTGRFLVPLLLNRGYEVVGIERTADPNRQHREIICDLTDPACLHDAVQSTQPTFVIHLAALSFAALEDELPYYQINLLGTQSLLQALAKLDQAPKLTILASSAAVYGVPPAGTSQLDETTMPNPVSHYAISKLAMEWMATSWFPKLPILITRPFNYTGLGQDPKFIIPKIVRHFRERLPKIEVGNLDVSREFSDVRDIARCYANLLEAGRHSEVVNLCSGKPHQLTQLFTLLQQLTGHSIEIVQNPAFMRENEIPCLFGNPAKLLQLTGFAPSIPISQTLAWMLGEDPASPGLP